MVCRMASGTMPCFILCVACICAVISGAGCLATPDSEETVPPQPDDSYSIFSFQVAEVDAEETLTRLIEAEISENPALAGYTIRDFYNDTPLVAVESRRYLPGDGARPYSGLYLPAHDAIPEGSAASLG